MDPAHPRHAAVGLLVAAAAPLLPAACIPCDWEPLPCDASLVAVAIPAGDTLALRTTVCIEQPGHADNPPRVDFFLDGYDPYEHTLEIHVDGVDASSLGHETPWTAAHCEDGLRITLANTGSTDFTGVVNLQVNTGDDADRCELTLDRP